MVPLLLVSHADSDLSFLSESVWQDTSISLVIVMSYAKSLFRQLTTAPGVRPFSQYAHESSFNLKWLTSYFL